LREDEEWSLDEKTESLIELTLEDWFHFLNIEEFPGLSNSVGVLPHLDETLFGVLVSLDFNNLGCFIIEELTVLVLEVLPPFTNGLTDFK
jgi:hypothetical protein